MNNFCELGIIIFLVLFMSGIHTHTHNIENKGEEDLQKRF